MCPACAFRVRPVCFQDASPLALDHGRRTGHLQGMPSDAPSDPIDELASLDAVAPSADAIATVAEEVRARFPTPFAALAAAVRIEVSDWAPDDVLDDLDMDDAYDLTGLYDGVPLTERGVSDPPTRPDVVHLFRRPILDEWSWRGDVTLRELVAHVTVHEFAHHFGWSDDDIARIDRWWE